jgi:hypothetical protein
MVRSDANSHRVAGRCVTEADINAAEQQLFDPSGQGRIAADLVEHAPERPPSAELRQLEDEAKAALRDPVEGPLSANCLPFLAASARIVVAKAISQSRPEPTPWLGALECTVHPPFGKSEA